MDDDINRMAWIIKSDSVFLFFVVHINAKEIEKLKNFAILSDGTFSNPKFFRTLEEKLAEFQRIMSRRTVGGSNWYKVKRKVACIHEKMANARKDYLHKISTDIVKNHDIIEILTQQLISKMKR